ncbi:MAG: serine protease [Oscillospiraceae bacterium]|nr:serine protease [Oscillospiraceae bacterium]
MSRKKKISLIVIGVVAVTVVGYAAVLFADIYSVDSEFIEAVNNQAISASVLLVVETEEVHNEEVTSISYSTGFSGVIFKKEENRYYVLTALHAIEYDNPKILVLRYDQPIWNVYVQGNDFIGSSSYYAQFPEAVIEYYDGAYDLAVLSFVSEFDFTVLSIASEPPEYNDSVAALGNPWENYNNSVAVTTGRVTSRSPVEFGDKAGKNQYNVIRHSARTSSGSSGGALLNRDMEIVGINLGGGENIFGWFIFSMAMPSDRILEFLNEADMVLMEK